MVFVFVFLIYSFFSMIVSSCILVAANGIISFFLWLSSMYVYRISCIHSSTDGHLDFSMSWLSWTVLLWTQGCMYLSQHSFAISYSLCNNPMKHGLPSVLYRWGIKGSQIYVHICVCVYFFFQFPSFSEVARFKHGSVCFQSPGISHYWLTHWIFTTLQSENYDVGFTDGSLKVREEQALTQLASRTHRSHLKDNLRSGSDEDQGKQSVLGD